MILNYYKAMYTCYLLENELRMFSNLLLHIKSLFIIVFEMCSLNICRFIYIDFEVK